MESADRTLAQAFLDLRLELDMTQREIAEKGGITTRTVKRIEAGQGARPLTLTRIANAVGRPGYFAPFLIRAAAVALIADILL